MRQLEYFVDGSTLVTRDRATGNISTFTYDRPETAELHAAVLDAERLGITNA